MNKTPFLNCCLMALILYGASAVAWGAAGQRAVTPVVRPAAQFGRSPALRDIPTTQERRTIQSPTLREIPRGDRPAKALPRRTARITADAALQRSAPRGAMPEPLMTFEGIGNLDGVAPPDTCGDVGPNHYVEMVNMHFCVYDKATGTNLIAPMLMSELFAAAGFPPPASTTDSGDPIVLYDPLANRWLLSQFIVSVTPCHEAIAISQTPDPTGPWFLYDFVMPNDKMNDYPKFGVWPDGYYMSDNQFNPNDSWGGVGVFAFDRAKMLAGDASATYQYIDLGLVNSTYSSLLPSDLDGTPPPSNAPNYFAMMDDEALNPFDALYVWAFHVDWAHPENSTFGNDGQPNYTNEVASFNSLFPNDRNTIRQPGVSQRLDPMGDRLLFRLQYRNFGAYESLVSSHAVNVGNDNQAGMRYYELRRALPDGAFTVQEQATFAPDAENRWMGSAALDGQGNMAVGYSVSSTSVYPSIRYAGRRADDPSNGLYLGEATLFAGAASQTGVNRWGDYSALCVDPVDDTTFWYVSQYTEGSWDWHTRIGSFRISDLQLGSVACSVSNALTGAGIPNAQLEFSNGWLRFTDEQGQFETAAPTGAMTLVVSSPGYYAATSTPFEVNLNETTAVHFALNPIPLQVTPDAGITASGPEGGAFAPPVGIYALSNGCLTEVAWAASNRTEWLTLSATGGVLSAGGTTALIWRLHYSADFLAPGVYSDAVTIAWTTTNDQDFVERSGRLAVSPRTPPALTNWNFQAGQPDGWSIEGDGWSFGNPCDRANLTGGDGGFAIADSDCAGEVPMDTQLLTPRLDLTGKTDIQLSFRNDYRIYSGAEVAAVDLSTNGAAGPWETLWQKSDALRGPTHIVLEAPAADQSNVMFRFHYTGNYDYWWEVDDVAVRGAPIEEGALQAIPLTGLDMNGYAGEALEQTKTYRLTNTTLAEIAWTASCDAVWFETQPANGVLAAGGAVLVTARASASAPDQAPGAYEGSLVFSNSAGADRVIRPVTLVLYEPLSLSPTSNITASGLEGGPFTPADASFLLGNESDHAVAWAASVTAPWLELSSTGGTLQAESSVGITATLLTNALTVPGVYADPIVFSNLQTGVALIRAVTVTVIEVTGRIGVYDSIPPTNDLYMPFGVVTGSAPRLEHITVRNTGENNRDLVISAIRLGYYQSSFDTDAAGWQPTFAEDWSVTNGAYRAAATSTRYMISTYTPRTWSDLSVEALMRRSGNWGLAQSVALRASSDFDPTANVGSGYLFQLSGNRNFSVFRIADGEATALQGWSFSSSINTSTNRMIVTANDNQLRFVVNGTMIWEGADSTLTNGHVTIGGYSTADNPTTYYFDEVKVTRPQPRILGVGRKQLYFNGLAQPDSELGGTDSGKLPPPAPAFPNDLEPMASGLAMNYFSLTNLPSLPATLAPNESMTFSVLYAPETAVTNTDNVLIVNNDNFTPGAEVALDGRAAAARLTGRIIDEYSTLPIAGALVTIDNGVTNWSMTTDTNGLYALTLPAGGWDFAVTVAEAHYTTGLAHLALSADGLIATQNFELTGSRLTYQPTALDRVVLAGGRVTNWVVFSNSGPLAISCSIAVTAASPANVAWCLANSNAISVAPGGLQSFEVIFDAHLLTSPPPAVSQAWLTFTGSFVNPLAHLPVTLRLASSDFAVLPADAQHVSGCIGGPFAPTSVLFTVSNLGMDSLDWTAAAIPAWLNLSSTTGTLAAGASQAIGASINTNAQSLALNAYQGTILFSNRTAGVVESRRIDLLVLPPRTNIVSYDMNADPGWSGQGEWAFGAPLGAGSHNHDPAAGFTGTNVYGYNLAGDYSNDLPRRCLTTPPLDLSRWINLELDFQRWLGLESAAYDHAGIESSTDGQNWTELWRHQGKSIADANWTTMTLSIPNSLATNSSVRFRWVMGATDESETYPGWNLDDVIVRGNRLRQLTLLSAKGQSTPAVGVHWLPEGLPATCVLTNPFIETARTQYVYIGWTGTGDAPASGTDTSTIFTLTQDSSVHWLWNSNVYFSKMASANGLVSGSENGWYALGASVLVWALPDENFRFAGWLGAPASNALSNPLLLTLNQAIGVTAIFEHDQLTLAIQSPHGNPNPPTGLHTNQFASIVTNRVTSPDTQDRTQYVCMGWVMTGNNPASGTTTAFSMAHTNHAVLSWLWRTNYLFTHAAAAHGSVIGSSTGWYGLGTPVIVSAAAERHYRFDRWTGEIDGNTNPLPLVMTQPWQVTANFAENRTTNFGTPEWWLAQFGWTNQFEAAAANDPDGDGIPTGAEYPADTSPTNRDSYLRLHGLANGQLHWSGGSGVFQYLEKSDNLFSNDWKTLATNEPPTPITNSLSLPEEPGDAFYRIRAVR